MTMRRRLTLIVQHTHEMSYNESDLPVAKACAAAPTEALRVTQRTTTDRAVDCHLATDHPCD